MLENLQNASFIGDRVLELTFATFEDALLCWSTIGLGGEVQDSVICFERVGIYFRQSPESVDHAFDLIAKGSSAVERREARKVEIPVRYGGEGSDLESAAEELGLDIQTLVEIHSGKDYLCYGVGFSPGFPYLGLMDQRISGLERLGNPRSRVPAGSIAVVDDLTAVYPDETPGGWRLIGKTPCRMVDVAEEYFPIQPGDTVLFVPVTQEEFEKREGEQL